MVFLWHYFSHENDDRCCRPAGGAEGAASGPRLEGGTGSRDPGGRRSTRGRNCFHPHGIEAQGQGSSRNPLDASCPRLPSTGARDARTRAAVKAADTSVVVAAFASWHEKHDAARRALDEGVRLDRALFARDLFGAYCGCRRRTAQPGEVARDFLAARFSGELLRLGGQRVTGSFLRALPERGRERRRSLRRARRGNCGCAWGRARYLRSAGAANIRALRRPLPGLIGYPPDRDDLRGRSSGDRRHLGFLAKPQSHSFPHGTPIRIGRHRGSVQPESNDERASGA